jgi:hypothetical protein
MASEAEVGAEAGGCFSEERSQEICAMAQSL